MNRTYDTHRQSGPAETPPPLAATHFDDQADRCTEMAPEDFPRCTGLGGHVHPDRPPAEELSTDPEVNIVPSDSPGG